MPKVGINLITQEGRERLQLLRIKLKVRRYLTVVGVLFSVAALLTIASFLLISKTVRDNENKIASLKNQIKNYDKTESYLITISNRLKSVSTVFAKRKAVSETMTLLSSLYTPGFSLMNIEILANGSVRLSGKCADVQSLIEFNERLENLRAKKKFSQIIYPTVSRTNGVYNLSLEFKK